MKGNVHGSLLDNLDSANSVEELTPTVESLPKHYAVMCAFLVACPNQTTLLVEEKMECSLNVWSDAKLLLESVTACEKIPADGIVQFRRPMYTSQT